MSDFRLIDDCCERFGAHMDSHFDGNGSGANNSRAWRWRRTPYLVLLEWGYEVMRHERDRNIRTQFLNHHLLIGVEICKQGAARRDFAHEVYSDERTMSN